MSGASFQISAVMSRHAGKIGLCPCPGRKYPPVLGTHTNHDLSRDLLSIRNFPAAVLVTLMEMGELDWAGPRLAELQAACGALGLQHLYLPIEDGGIPGPQWEAGWQRHSPGLHSLLRAGHNIIFHCRGGRGRAGLAATRMLIETGEDPAPAMSRVRDARSGAIETRDQEAYLLRLRDSFQAT